MDIAILGPVTCRRDDYHGWEDDASLKLKEGFATNPVKSRGAISASALWCSGERRAAHTTARVMSPFEDDTMEIYHRGNALMVSLLVVNFLSSWPQVQTINLVKSAAKDKHSETATQTQPQFSTPALPLTIRVGGTEMPLTEAVPNAEAALSRLQDIQGKTKNPTLLKLRQSLDTLSDNIVKSSNETTNLIRNARSAEQLAETSYIWRRKRQELENLNVAVRSYVQSFTEEQRQVREIQQKWSVPDQHGGEVGIPPELLKRIQQVQQTASTADSAIRSTLQFLVQLQVRISDDRRVVDDILQLTNIAERTLLESIFVLNGPPIWSAMHGSSYGSLQEQARITRIAVRSQVLTFYSSHRNGLLAYLVLLLALAAAFFRLRGSEVQRTTLPSSHVLQNPFSLAAFILLFFFGLFFPTAPPEVILLSQFLLIFPMLRIVLAVFERALRLPVVALGIFYALDGMTSHAAAGTLCRRLLVLALTVASLAVVAWANRTRGPVRSLLVQKGWTMAGLLPRFAVICLAVAAISNVVGSVSLADLLMLGTLRSIWAAIAVYVMYLALHGLISVLTMTRIGQMSRLVRLHRDLVLTRVGTVLRLAAWMVWIGDVLFAYQIARQVFAGALSVFKHKWTIGAVSVSLGDIAIFFLVLIAASWLAKGICFLLEEELLPRTHLSSGAAQSGSRLAHYALLLIGFFLALAAAGLDLGRVTLLTGAFGVGLGFGLQSLVNNFVSGIIISLERPLQVGHVIEIENLLGKVTAIGLRSSTVRTVDGAEVIVPNSELISKSFVNWSLTDQLRRGELRVGVAYSTEPARVLQILTRIAGAHPGVLKDPQPLITFEEFGESALVFSLRFWTRIENLDSVRSDLNVLVAEELGQSGMLVALPTRGPQLYEAVGARHDT